MSPNRELFIALSSFSVHRGNMKKILCRLGFHDWWPEDRNVFEPMRVLYRTYMKCKRCDKYGKLTFFKEVQV